MIGIMIGIVARSEGASCEIPAGCQILGKIPNSQNAEMRTMAMITTPFQPKIRPAKPDQKLLMTYRRRSLATAREISAPSSR